MALNKYHYIEIDTKRSPRISLQNIVAGETGNRIWVTVTNDGEKIDMAEKADGDFIYRVVLRVDSDLGTRRQDSAVTGNGITLIDADTAYHGMVNIRLSADSFTAGKNRCRLEIYSKQWTANDTLICSAEWTFDAAGNPTGVNAGAVYPSLIALENELRALLNEASLLSNIYVTKVDDVVWTGTAFQGYAEDSEEAHEAYENGKVFAVYAINDDDEINKHLFIESERDDAAEEIVCRCIGGGHCTVSLGGDDVQIFGDLIDD